MPFGTVSFLILLFLAGAARAGAPYALDPTATEMAARPELGRILANIRFLEVKLRPQTTRLAVLTGERGRLVRERQGIEDELSVLTGRLKAMLPKLWEMEVRLSGVLEASDVAWDESDRNLNWLGAVYGLAREEAGRVGTKNSALAANLAKEARLRPEIDTQAAQTEAIKDALLAERLKLLRELTALRREKPAPAQRLEHILEQASLADISPVSTLDKPLETARGALPWPATGTISAVFAPDGLPPVNGIGITTAAGAKVSAVHWGRVAYAGELKGLGTVVVLSHGGGALTVYSHLSSSSVKAGQELARGEMLGTVGKLQPGTVSGMYFELRFGLKPINPSRWFPAG
ncbi:MAG: peptidoglycan DD-metalloendopeptidase family protein [Desulfovibrio sp.]|nr:peptidoglycan DD-metalloendopeptidase family protein [Desulfovibrio sp.]MBI4960069.1 peptidoglycan DD-metalloendopeptidase family protein [Desulfovibrio sp.]